MSIAKIQQKIERDLLHTTENSSFSVQDSKYGSNHWNEKRTVRLWRGQAAILGDESMVDLRTVTVRQSRVLSAACMRPW